MRTFADTLYWLAMVDPADQWHDAAVKALDPLEDVELVTTDEVLSEFLAALSGAGEGFRSRAARTVHALLEHPRVTVVEQSRESFLGGLKLYESRPDKGYSLTDCISMNTMRDQGISMVLTHDRHFEQEGFAALIR